VQHSTAPAAATEQQQGAAAVGGNPSAAAAAAAGDGSSRREMVAVVLEFTLPPSCYATMLVRELTKSSTSKASHAKLSAKA
jgi:tRNA(Glu) U13 pseudouridine synthase TruD